MLVHTYWDGNEMPIFNQRCMRSWLRYIPSVSIMIWNDRRAISEQLINLSIRESYLNLTYYRRSDLVRVLALAKYGGIWMDSSVCLRSEPIHLTRYNDGEFRGYTMPGSPKAIENWAFAASASHRLLQNWSIEMERLVKLGDELYISSVPKAVIEECNLQRWLPYLASHLALIVARKRIVEYCKVSLLPAASGPLWHVPGSAGTAHTLIEDLCNMNAAGVWYHVSRYVGVLQLVGVLPAPSTAAIKFRSIDRDVLPTRSLPWSPLRRYFS